MTDWNDLRYFLAVSREKTLSGAARALKVDHSTVGRRLASLERSLETQLFERTPEGLLLTEAGQELLPAMQAAEDLLLHIERRAGGGDADADLAGIVRVAATETFALCVMIPSLPAFRAKHPSIHIELVTSSVSANLARREADVAVRMHRPEQNSLISRKIGEMVFALYAAPHYLARHPFNGNLDGHELVGFDDELSALPEARWLAEHDRGATTVLRANSLPMMAQAVAEGIGVGVISCIAAAGLVRLGCEEISRREIWLALHNDLGRNKRVRAVLEHVTAVVSARQAELLGNPRPRPCSS
jgi:DNA-binding transcriptional LysR family regulator